MSCQIISLSDMTQVGKTEIKEEIPLSFAYIVIARDSKIEPWCNCAKLFFSNNPQQS